MVVRSAAATAHVRSAAAMGTAAKVRSATAVRPAAKVRSATEVRAATKVGSTTEVTAAEVTTNAASAEVAPAAVMETARAPARSGTPAAVIPELTSAAPIPPTRRTVEPRAIDEEG